MKLAYIENPLDHSKLSNPMGVSTFIIQSLRNCGAIVIPVKSEPVPFFVNFYLIKKFNSNFSTTRVGSNVMLQWKVFVFLSYSEAEVSTL